MNTREQFEEWAEINACIRDLAGALGVSPAHLTERLIQSGIITPEGIEPPCDLPNE